MKFTDSHCHLDFTEFNKALPQLLNQCIKNNINRIIVPSVNPEHWQRVLTLSKQHNTKIKVASALGIHPWFLIVHDKLKPKNLDLDLHQQQLASMVSQYREKIVAIGECGIDVFKAKKNTIDDNELASNIRLQQDFFDMQLALASQHNLPIIVHHCQSHHYILAQLKQHKLAKAGVIHAFSGSYQQAKDYIDLGFKLGVGGTITYPRAKKTINAIKRLPLSSLVLETDAPAMPPIDQQGMANSPLNLLKVFQALVEIRDESAEKIATQIEVNVEQLFFNHHS
ncbi:MAG: TatD family hydrolase [Colwellia sp.]|nr:TatD family hydrolase [Colwellia sp.]